MPPTFLAEIFSDTRERERETREICGTRETFVADQSSVDNNPRRGRRGKNQWPLIYRVADRDVDATTA